MVGPVDAIRRTDRSDQRTRPLRPPPGGGTRRPEVRHYGRRSRRPLVLGTAVLASLVATFAVAGVDTGRIPPKVAVDGVDVSGLTPAQARTRLQAHVRDRLSGEIALSATGGRPYQSSVSASRIARAPQLAGVVEEARSARGRLGRVLVGVGIGGEQELPLRFSLRGAGVTAVVADARSALDRPAVDAQVRVAGGEVVVRASQPGTVVDRAELERLIETLPASVGVPTREAPPVIDDEDARVAQGRATAMLATPRTLTYAARSAPLRPGLLRRALRFPARDGALAVDLDPNVLRAGVLRPLGIRERAPRDARLEIRGRRVVVVSSLPGVRFDKDALTRAILANPTAPEVAVVTETRPASFRTADARALKITELVSSFTTPYVCCPPRVTNIRRATETLDGMILKPGERFSLNAALGQRTTERGYVSAPTIQAGELKDSVGGGVSQIATTVYNAAYFAGLEIVTHTPHEFWISRYPKGREATVSWGSPDLAFVNDWKASILVDAVAASDGVTISFYSSPLGRRIETDTAEPTEITKPKTIERLDPDLPKGTRNELQDSGADGFYISYTRRVYAGERLKRTDRFGWRYRPQNAIIEVGPPKPKKPGDPDGDDPATEPDAAAPGATPEPEPSTDPVEGSDPAPALPPSIPTPPEP